MLWLYSSHCLGGFQELMVEYALWWDMMYNLYLTDNSHTKQIRILYKELEFWLIFSDDFAHIRIIPVCKLKKKGYYVFSIAFVIS